MSSIDGTKMAKINAANDGGGYNSPLGYDSGFFQSNIFRFDYFRAEYTFLSTRFGMNTE